MSSLTKILDYTSKIAITCFCSLLLIACDPLIFGGISGLGGSSSFSVTQCASGPADLSSQCRTATPTPGALEAIGTATSAAVLNVTTSAQPVITGSTLNINWPPYPGTAAGYYVYYGPTTDTATTLASDLAIGTANFNTSVPSISYQPAVDLGVNTGATVCFRIYAYDIARVIYEWSEVQCRVV